jgi:hypothetical protein
MALTSKVLVTAVATHTNPLDLATGTVPLSVEARIPLASGTGANQADRIFHDRRTITASGTDSLDLAGVLTDAFGATITFAKLKAVVVKAAAGNTNNVNVTRPAVNGVPWFLAAGDGIPVLPGGAFSWVAPGAGVTVTAATGDLIDIVNSGAGTSVTYDIIIIGTSA